MPRVWIVNPFDPLPGDTEQPGRYASLARLLREAGCDVTWWSCDFSHRFKRPLDPHGVAAACRAERITVRLTPAPAYRRNVGLRRIFSHRVLARRFERQATDELRHSPPPQVVIASNPPPDSAATAARVARGCGARLIVDVQDDWIGNFGRMFPRGLRWTSPLLLRPWITATRAAYESADAIVGVAAPYADDPQRFGRRDYRRLVVPLGIDLASFDAAAGAGRCLLGEKPPGEIWSIYSGSLSRSYDVLTAARVAVEISARRPNVRFVFSGRGELESQMRRILEGAPRSVFLGFAPFEDWAATIAQCDVGWNAVRPDALVWFPNKIFYYWAAGLAIMNTIPGECAEWVERTGSGLTYACGDAADAVRRFEELIADPQRLAERRRAARRSAVERWDRRRLYEPYVELIQELAAGRSAAPREARPTHS